MTVDDAGKVTAHHLEDIRSLKANTSHVGTLDPEAIILDIDPEGGGKALAGDLKLASDGHTVLVPQPSDDPGDPLNWPSWKKNSILLTASICSFTMDFQLTAALTLVFLQGADWDKSPEEINVINNISSPMLGIGGLVLMPFLYSWGRAPTCFWATVVSAFLSLGCVLAPSFRAYYALKLLTAFFLATGLMSSLALIQDMFFHHEKARKIGIWTSMWMASPYLGPMFGNFINNRLHDWHYTLWLCFAMNMLNVVLIGLFYDETWYRRDIALQDQPERGTRLQRLLGIWQIRHHRSYFRSVRHSYRRLLAVTSLPLVLPVGFSSLLALSWIFGIAQCIIILLSTPEQSGGYGLSGNPLSYFYFAPLVGLIVGEVFGHWFIDFSTKGFIRKNQGIFKPEARIFPIYLSTFFTTGGLILVGQALEEHLSEIAVASGWAIYNVGAILEAVGTNTYLIDTYPYAAAEIASILNLLRLIGGFASSYNQMKWGAKVGYAASFGTQAGLVVFSTAIMVVLHYYGPRLRLKSGLIKLD
ncbi:major facilitator superfamily domain-containing protein [Mariannaea sp. PMI_226]|nr:major facilitator superfamily domain-containing protein [Mariannaea sp. PMI_226]